jgi:plastocyanin
MKLALSRLAVPALLLMPAAAFGQGDHVVQQKNRRFMPGEITIKRGESITVTNNDNFIHQIYADGLFDSEEKPPGENLVESFPRAGTFEVRCHIHPKMRLIVRVN